MFRKQVRWLFIPISFVRENADLFMTKNKYNRDYGKRVDSTEFQFMRISYIIYMQENHKKISIPSICYNVRQSYSHLSPSTLSANNEFNYTSRIWMEGKHFSGCYKEKIN